MEKTDILDELEKPSTSSFEAASDEVFARLYGEPLFDKPEDLYIPPNALKILLQSFEGPLDLLLFLIRKQKFDIMDIPMALLTEQYMAYVEGLKDTDFELAADYLVMAASLLRIKSQLLLPVTHLDTGEEVEDPQAELARRLLEYEKMKLAALDLEAMPRCGRDFFRAFVLIEQEQAKLLPQVRPEDLAQAWAGIVRRARLNVSHQVSRQELSVREFMSTILRQLRETPFMEFHELFSPEAGVQTVIVNYLAILELAKEGFIRITQAAPFAPLYVMNALTEAKSSLLTGETPCFLRQEEEEVNEEKM